MVKKVKLSWSTIESKVKFLADKLKNEKFDAVISIGRGGMVPARLLAEKLDIHTAFIIDAKAYTSEDKLGEMQISNINLPNNIHRVLIVDDCIFTGTTLDAVMSKIAENNNIEYIVNAFLYKNIKMNKIQSNFIYAEKYDGNAKWLVFPWEIV